MNVTEAEGPAPRDSARRALRQSDAIRRGGLSIDFNRGPAYSQTRLEDESQRKKENKSVAGRENNKTEMNGRWVHMER